MQTETYDKADEADARSLFPEATDDQIEAFERLLQERGGMTGSRSEDVMLVACYYSRVVGSYECCEWLPFQDMGGWEEDVKSIIEDEDYWCAARNEGKMGYEIWEVLKARSGAYQSDPAPLVLYPISSRTDGRGIVPASGDTREGSHQAGAFLMAAALRLEPVSPST